MHSRRRRRSTWLAVLALVASAIGAASALQARRVPSVVECALLDDPRVAGRMDGLLLQLARGCGRSEFLEGGSDQLAFLRVGLPVADVPASDPTGEGPGTSGRTQSETTVAVSGTTGTVCAAWNDSYHGIVQGLGFSGFGRSTDGGQTFTDRGAISDADGGDPSLVWRQADAAFYFAALQDGGIALYRSTDDCSTFELVGTPSGGLDDKELLAVDNGAASPHAGNLYLVWTDFGYGGEITASRSTDAGLTWSLQVPLSAGFSGEVQGAWPAVAPNGDVYVGWVRWIGSGFPNGEIRIEIAKSTDGGQSFAQVAPPMSGRDGPRDLAASAECGRPALGGRIRHLPSPTVALDGAGRLHVVYSYDPDGVGYGDESNVYYRRSSDGGASWEAEILVNEDGGLTDQWQPTLSAGAGPTVVVGYYSRESDPLGNHLFAYFSRSSYDGGATFAPAERRSEVDSDVVHDAEVAVCYHGDYDTQVQHGGRAHLLWSDDRDPDAGGEASPTPNAWAEAVSVGTDFLLVPDPDERSVCAGSDALFPIGVAQFGGFAEAVTLAAAGNPGATSVAFDPNPVNSPGATLLTIGNTAAESGSSTIAITGVASPSGIQHASSVALTVRAAAPAAAVLVAPADGAVDEPRAPLLTWQAAAGAERYLVELALDAAFTQIVRAAETLAPSWEVRPLLDPLTEYFWRVAAINACGSTVSAARSFTTLLPTVLLVDDDDDGPDVVAHYEGAMDGVAFYDLWDVEERGGEPAAADLAPYRAVVWFTGRRYTGTDQPSCGPQAAGEAALAAFLDNGRCLLVSAQDYLWDMGGFFHDVPTPFMRSHLGVSAGGDYGGLYAEVDGRESYAQFDELPLDFWFSDFSDWLKPDPTSEHAFAQSRPVGERDTKAVARRTPIYVTTYVGFPLEALTAVDRSLVLARFFELCEALGVLFADNFEDQTWCDWDAATVPCP